jgi:thioredoxin-related protein
MTTMDHRTGPTFLAVILLLAVLVSVAVAGEESEEKFRSITWLGYNDALAKARDFDKPVYLHFTAKWCKWCVKMQDETYTDPRVIRFMSENFYAVMIDTEKNPALARKFGVSGLPTLWFLDSHGQGLTSVDGYMTPDTLLRILEYVSTKAYEEIDYEKWVHKHHSK